MHHRSKIERYPVGESPGTPGKELYGFEKVIGADIGKIT